MEKELKERLDEIADSTMVAVGVGKPAEAAIEQMKTIDPNFHMSDKMDIVYLIEFYVAAREFYSGNDQPEEDGQSLSSPDGL